MLAFSVTLYVSFVYDTVVIIIIHTFKFYLLRDSNLAPLSISSLFTLS